MMFVVQQTAETISTIARDATPFFSDNWQGVVKIITIIVLPTVGLIGAFIWRVMQGPLQKEDERIEEYSTAEIKRIEGRIDAAIDAGRRDLNGMGERINSIQQSCTENSTEVAELKRRMDGHDFAIGGLKESIGELRATVENVERVTIDTKTEIIGNFMVAKNDMVSEVHKLAVLVARVDERVQMSKLLNNNNKDGS